MLPLANALRAVNIHIHTIITQRLPEWVWLYLLMNYDWRRVKCIAIAGKVYDTAYNVCVRHMYARARECVCVHKNMNRIIQYSVRFHLFQKICLQCQPRCVCVREWVRVVHVFMALAVCIFGLMWVIWRTFNPTHETGKNSADTHTHTFTIFKWEMTNATETAQTAIKFIIYLNCQAFFVASFLCTQSNKHSRAQYSFC